MGSLPLTLTILGRPALASSDEEDGVVMRIGCEGGRGAHGGGTVRCVRLLDDVAELELLGEILRGAATVALALVLVEA
jgi:hypothetical protein